MTMRVLAGAALLTVLAVSASVATAEVYKSVDENGRVVFSQKPPQGTKSEVIKPRYSKPPTAPAGGPAPFVPPAQPGGSAFHRALGSLHRPQTRWRVIASLRSSHIGKLATLPGMAEWIDSSLYRLRPLSHYLPTALLAGIGRKARQHRQQAGDHAEFQAGCRVGDHAVIRAHSAPIAQQAPCRSTFCLFSRCLRRRSS